MKKELIKTLTKNFESVSHAADDVEYWLARETSGIIGIRRMAEFHAGHRESKNRRVGMPGRILRIILLTSTK